MTHEASPVVMWAIFLGYHAIATLWFYRLWKRHKSLGEVPKNSSIATSAIALVFVFCAWSGYSNELFNYPLWVSRSLHALLACCVVTFLLAGGVSALAGDRD